MAGIVENSQPKAVLRSLAIDGLVPALEWDYLAALVQMSRG